MGRIKWQIRETLIINKGGRPKITHFFGLQTIGLKEKKRKKEDQSKGMDLWSLVWNLSME